MKQFIYSTVLLGLLSCQVEQKQDEVQEKSIDQKTEELLTTLYNFNLAFAESNASLLEPLLTDQYTHTNGSSAPYTKEVWLNYIKSRKEKIEEGTLIVDDYGMTDIQMTFYDKSALVNGIVYSKGTEKGVPFDKQFRVTHLWVMESNQWKRAAFHDGVIE